MSEGVQGRPRVVLSGDYSRTCLAPRETRALYVATYPANVPVPRAGGTSISCSIRMASTRAPNMRGFPKPSVVAAAEGLPPSCTQPQRSARDTLQMSARRQESPT
jgi:hypothetical protein